jgi:hypothetical protein
MCCEKRKLNMQIHISVQERTDKNILTIFAKSSFFIWEKGHGSFAQGGNGKRRIDSRIG